MTNSSPVVTPTNSMIIRENMRLAPGVHVVPNGLTIAADGVTLDGGGAVLVGSDRQRPGISLLGRKGVRIVNCRLREYAHGIHASNCRDLTLSGNEIRSTAEIAANTIFLDIWKPACEAYGGAILLHDVTDSVVEANDIQHQMNGLLTYGCSKLTVRNNNASYCSGFGFYLHATCDSVFEDNFADYCCRYEPRGQRTGHVGADAAGFVIVHRSCRNAFRRNLARLGGDGFFLAGLTPSFEKAGCDENLFEENDGSLSPNIAFEATFSRGNVFRNNRADYCNFGFWLGYSWENALEDNRMLMNRQAGVAVEHGRAMQVRRNQLHGNGHGVLLWTKPHEAFLRAFPEQATSRDWTIEHNTFTRNGIGIRIAADQDHGIRNMDPMPAPEARCRPADHVIRHNEFRDNRVGVELVCCDWTEIVKNTFSGNVEAGIRETDCRDTTSRPNMGLAGAYIN